MKFLKIMSGAAAKVESFFSRLPVAFCAVWAFFINLLIEAFSRHSLIKGAVHMFTSPGAFLYNALIVFAFSLICLFFKRRFFALLISTLPLLILGISNGVAFTYRSMPVSANDFVKLGSVFGVVKMYFKPYIILLIAAAVLLIVWGLVLLYKKSRVLSRKPRQGAISLSATAAVMVILFFVFNKTGVLSKRFTSFAESYFDYGFLYCFSSSVFGMGIEEPLDYSSEKMNTILDDIRAEENLVPDKTPNIVFLQLESFFDVANMKNASFSEDPTPFFNSLKENFPGGYLTVPCVGAGTVNVEFEVLTGMTLDFFGLGEYPYKTVLQETACETLAYNLKENGYTAHAIHNHYGLFYDRAHVFSNLGFDTYTFLELMNDVSLNPIGWACDDVLTGEIVKALDSTEKQDFVFAISVQSHGSYPENPESGWTAPIDCTVSAESKNRLNESSLEYYASQLSEVDAFVKELVETLEARDEETVLVIYGDHIPYFTLTNDDLVNGDIYQTEYVIWSNFGLEAANTRNLSSWELSAYVMDLLGMNNGLITKLHQNASNHPDYMKYLELLQYDMLYGSKGSYGAEDGGYAPTDIKYGITTPVITSVRNSEKGAYVVGEGFNEWSRVYINGESYSSVECLNSTTLYIPRAELFYGDTVVVKQTNGRRVVFNESDEYIAGDEVNMLPKTD